MDWGLGLHWIVVEGTLFRGVNSFRRRRFVLYGLYEVVCMMIGTIMICDHAFDC